MRDLVIYLLGNDPGWKSALGASLQDWEYSFQDVGSIDEMPPMADCTCVIVNTSDIRRSWSIIFNEIRQKSSSSQIIFFGEFAAAETIVQALQFGAIDWFDNAGDLTRLRRAIERARTQAMRSIRLRSLSARERDVLLLLVDGLLNKQVASRLGISHRTVELYRARIMKKLAVGCFAELIITFLFANTSFDEKLRSRID